MGGRLGGWVEIWRLNLTQVVVEVEVGVELGNLTEVCNILSEIK